MNFVYFGLFLYMSTLWAIAQQIQQKTIDIFIPDKIELNFEKNCVTINSLSAIKVIENVFSMNLPEKINILKTIQESCAKSEKIYATHSGLEMEYNQDELLPLNFPYKSNQKISDILVNLTQLSNYEKNYTTTLRKELAVMILTQYEIEKNTTLSYLRRLLNLRIERIRDILKYKIGASIKIFQPIPIYDRTEIDDFLLSTDIPNSDGYKFYSYSQLENTKNELKEVARCSQLGYQICPGQKLCFDFLKLFTDTTSILFQSNHLIPLYNQLNNDVTLYYDLYMVKGQRGRRGKDGLRGDRGQIGRSGYSGAKGDKGDKGEKGYRGDDGVMGYHGLNIAEQIGYPSCYKKKCKDNSTSVIINTTKVSLKGLKGDTGATGIKGDRGFQGLKGSKGLSSAKGVIKQSKFRKGVKGIAAISSNIPVITLPINSVNINDVYWSNIFRTLLFERVDIDKVFYNFYNSI